MENVLGRIVRKPSKKIRSLKRSWSTQTLNILSPTEEVASDCSHVVCGGDNDDDTKAVGGDNNITEDRRRSSVDSNHSGSFNGEENVAPNSSEDTDSTELKQSSRKRKRTVPPASDKPPRSNLTHRASIKKHLSRAMPSPSLKQAALAVSAIVTTPSKMKSTTCAAIGPATTPSSVKRKFNFSLKSTEKRKKEKYDSWLEWSETRKGSLHSGLGGGSGLTNGNTTVMRRMWQTDKMWRELVSEEVLDGLSTLEAKRQERIYELISTEKKLAADLREVIKVYRDPLLKLGHITPDDAAILFCNIDDVVNAHTSLSTSLMDRMDTNTLLTDAFGDVLVEKVAQLQVDTIYIANLIDARAKLDFLTESNKAFCEYIEQCRMLPLMDRRSLWSMLDAPRQRIGRYQMLLAPIVDMSPESQDTTDMLEAVKIVKDIASSADIATRKSANRSRLECLSTHMNFTDPATAVLFDPESQEIVLETSAKNGLGHSVVCFLIDGPSPIMIVARTLIKDNETLYVASNPMNVQTIISRADFDDSIRIGRSLSLSSRTHKSSSPAAKQTQELSVGCFHVRDTVSNSLYNLDTGSAAIKDEWIAAIERIRVRLLQNKIDEMCANDI